MSEHRLNIGDKIHESSSPSYCYLVDALLFDGYLLKCPDGKRKEYSFKAIHDLFDNRQWTVIKKPKPKVNLDEDLFSV